MLVQKVHCHSVARLAGRLETIGTNGATVDGQLLAARCLELCRFCRRNRRSQSRPPGRSNTHGLRASDLLVRLRVAGVNSALDVSDP